MTTAEKLTAKQPVSEATKRLNPAIFGAPVHVPGLVDVPTQRAIRQKVGDGMNKAERLAYDYLRNQYGEDEIRFEGVTLRLANGVKFTPDFAVKHPAGLGVYEVKAMRGKRVHLESDASVKLKVSAREWRGIPHFLIWYDKTKGTHQTQEVLP